MDEVILTAVGEGARTRRIAARLGSGVSYSTLRRGLLRLERSGRIERDPRLSYINSIWWKPTQAADHHI